MFAADNADAVAAAVAAAVAVRSEREKQALISRAGNDNRSSRDSRKQRVDAWSTLCLIAVRRDRAAELHALLMIKKREKK